MRSPKQRRKPFTEFKPSVEEATKIINNELETRSKACMEEINQVLAKHQCEMFVQGQFAGNQCVSQVLIKPK